MVRDLLAQLSPEIQQIAAPLVQRYETYFQKLGARVQEVEAEGDAGLTEIIGMNVLDQGAISGAFSTLQTRFQNLGSKISNAMEKIEEDWEEKVEDLDLDDEAQERALRMMWNTMLKGADAMDRDIEKRSNILRIRKAAEWTRAIYPIAQQEWEKTRNCSECGSEFKPPLIYQSSNYNCPYCNAVNMIEVGPATGLYFQGLGVHSLAEETTMQHWIVMFDAENAYNDLRNPTDQDRQNYLNAVRNYWTAYYTEFKRLHPGFAEEIPNAVEAKMKHYDVGETKVDEKERGVLGNLVQLAASRNEQQLWQYITSVPEDDLDLDDAVRAAYEHGDRDGAILLLKMKHAYEKEDTPLNEFIREELEYLDEQ